ncbi:MAG: thioredoxin family protein [Patescibacteria group bacterium]
MGKNITIQLVSTPGCTHCEEVRKVLHEVKSQYPQMQIQELDATNPDGLELVAKHGILASPGVIINGELFATGGLNKDSFIKKLASLKN